MLSRPACGLRIACVHLFGFSVLSLFLGIAKEDREAKERSSHANLPSNAFKDVNLLLDSGSRDLNSYHH